MDYDNGYSIAAAQFCGHRRLGILEKIKLIMAGKQPNRLSCG